MLQGLRHLLSSGGGAAAVIKKRRIKLSAPDLSRKDIFLAIGDNELSEETTKLLVSKRYLIAEKYDIDKPEELAKDTKNSEPDLIILGLDKDHDLDKLKEIIETINKEAESDYAFLVHPDVLTDDLKSVLDKMVEDEEIIGYAENGSKEFALIKLILPIYKSELSFDDSVESVGKIAGLLGIDGVARIVDIYGAGKNIADTAKKDPNFVKTASIAGSIAEIFGWDSVSEITDFIDSVDEKKGYIDEEIERQKVINDYPEE